MGAFAKKDQEFLRQLGWEIASISSYLDEVRHFWAKTLGISGPQWRIILVLAEIDNGGGVPVNSVSKMLHVDSSFVTTQSKLLEKGGFINRNASSEDGRIVKLSLTDKTWKHPANLASPQEKLNDFIFAEFAPPREIGGTDHQAWLSQKKAEESPFEGRSGLLESEALC